MRVYPILTHDPASGEELVVTRLEAPESGVVIEGLFSLGWMGRLTPEQLDFVGLLLRNRNNLQKLANDLGVAYNTARSRLDEIVTALGGEDAPAEEPSPDPVGGDERRAILQRLSAKELTPEQAAELLRKR